MNAEHRLLVLSCSKQKRANQEPLPAIERYDGPPFRVLRKFLREYPAQSKFLQTYILSAEFGLMPEAQMIPNYDRRMTAKRARVLRPRVLNQLQSILESKQYGDLLISLSRIYLQALGELEAYLPPAMEVKFANGGQGHKLSVLYNWLRSDLHAEEGVRSPKYADKAIIRGVELTHTREQVLEAAQEALKQEWGNPR